MGAEEQKIECCRCKIKELEGRNVACNAEILKEQLIVGEVKGSIDKLVIQSAAYEHLPAKDSKKKTNATIGDLLTALQTLEPFTREEERCVTNWLALSPDVLYDSVFQKVGGKNKFSLNFQDEDEARAFVDFLEDLSRHIDDAQVSEDHSSKLYEGMVLELLLQLNQNLDAVQIGAQKQGTKESKQVKKDTKAQIKKSKQIKKKIEEILGPFDRKKTASKRVGIRAVLTGEQDVFSAQLLSKGEALQAAQKSVSVLEGQHTQTQSEIRAQETTLEHLLKAQAQAKQQAAEQAERAAAQVAREAAAAQAAREAEVAAQAARAAEAAQRLAAEQTTIPGSETRGQPPAAIPDEKAGVGALLGTVLLLALAFATTLAVLILHQLVALNIFLSVILPISVGMLILCLWSISSCYYPSLDSSLEGRKSKTDLIPEGSDSFNPLNSSMPSQEPPQERGASDATDVQEIAIGNP